MNRVRRPPLQHPLAPVFERAVDSLCIALSPDTTRHYRATVRKFLGYLGADHPEVNSPGSTAPRSSYPRLDVPTAFANAAAVDRVLHQSAHRSALPLQRTGMVKRTSLNSLA